MPTPTEILATFPEVADADNLDVYTALAEARTAEVAVWGGDENIRNLAVALLAAHMMVRAGLGSSGSAAAGVTSERIGSLSVSYGQSQATTAAGDLGSTSFGLQLVELRNENILTARTSYDG